MKTLATTWLLATLLGGAGMVVQAVTQPSQTPVQPRWGRGGLSRWPMGPGAVPPANVSLPRHHLAMTQGVPAPYTLLTNPLPDAKGTVEQGARIYAQQCVSCHGVAGLGDGEAGRQLQPPPGNLAWLSRVRLGQQDAYMYWAVAEGGAPIGGAMPAFKAVLAKEDIWAVVAYIQARLPEVPAQP